MRSSIIISVLFIALLTACEYENPEVAYHISGLVTDSEAGDSLNLISVQLLGFGESATVITADTGKFSFEFTRKLTDYTGTITVMGLGVHTNTYYNDTLHLTIGSEDFKKTDSELWGKATKYITFQLDSLP